MNRKAAAYLSKHFVYNAIIHVLIGIGIGIIITYPLIGAHPLRWGVGFLVLGIIGHLYPQFIKK